MRTLTCLAVAAVAAACLAVAPLPPDATRVVATNLSREQIRSMPVVERPSRPGHFYGNAVRRRYHRQVAPAPWHR